MNSYEVFIRQPGFKPGYELVITRRDYTGKIQVAKPIKLEFKDYKEGDCFESTLEIGYHLHDNLLKALKDALNSLPDSETEGQLKAIKYHLEDMRKLVFKENK